PPGPREASATIGRCRTSYKFGHCGRAGQTRDTRWETLAAAKSRASAWSAAGAWCRRSPVRRTAPRRRAILPQDIKGIKDRETSAPSVKASLWIVTKLLADLGPWTSANSPKSDVRRL